MRIKHIIYILYTIFTIACLVDVFTKEPSGEKNETSMINNIPNFDFHLNITNYKVDTFLSTAEYLQSIDKDKRIQFLKKLSKIEGKEMNVVILCRVLFRAKPGSEFREPSLGRALMIDYLEKNLCPSTPIMIIENIPFLVTSGYFIAGQAEAPSAYLDYCINNCEWAEVMFHPKSSEEKKKAFTSLISFIQTRGRNHILSKKDTDFLINQL